MTIVRTLFALFQLKTAIRSRRTNCADMKKVINSFVRQMFKKYIYLIFEPYSSYIFLDTPWEIPFREDVPIVN